MSDSIKDFDPRDGLAFQGDISIIPIPSDIAINRTEEISPIDGRLIIQEGELTGHHHAIDLRPPRVHSVNSQVERLMSDASGGRIPLPSAHFYRDPKVVEGMVRRGILTRSDLSIGVLIVEVGPMVLRHEEHDGIRLPVGVYLIGRQVESAGAEERRIAD